MQLKRKGDDAVYPEPGSLISPKRPRQELPAVFEEPIPEVCPVEVANDTPVHDFPTSALVITEPDADERAIVLYKPMNTLFSGASSEEELSIQVNAAFPKGFQWAKAFKQRFGYPLDDPSSTSNKLAVIPYVPPSGVSIDEAARSGTDSQGGRVIIEDITDQLREEEANEMQVEEAEPMDMECEDMAVDSTPPVVQQFNATAGWEVPNWQLHSPPSYTPVLWST